MTIPDLNRKIDSKGLEIKRLKEEMLIWQKNLEHAQGDLYNAEKEMSLIPGLNERIRQLEFNTKSNSDLIIELTKSLEMSESKASRIPELENEIRNYIAQLNSYKGMLGEIQHENET